MPRVGIGVDEAHGHGFELFGGNPGDRPLECVPVERADHLALVVKSFRHLEAPASTHQRRWTLLIHIVKPHQPQSAYLKQIAKAFRRNQSGACTAALNYRVCRNGSAMYQLPDIAAGYACFLKHVRDTGEDRLGVIAARRQDLPDKGAVAGEEDEVGKSAADIDTEATRKISIHSLLISPHGLGHGLSDIALNLGLR